MVPLARRYLFSDRLRLAISAGGVAVAVVDLVERFVRAEGEVDLAEFRARAAAFLGPDASVRFGSGSDASRSQHEARGEP